MASKRGHGDLIQKDLIDQLMDFLEPAINAILDRLIAEEFSTIQFIELMLTDEVAKAMYDDALVQWGESVQYSKMVVHGQVIPGVLRRSSLIEWAGYAHGEHDPYAVPAWWIVKPRE